MAGSALEYGLAKGVASRAGYEVPPNAMWDASKGWVDSSTGTPIILQPKGGTTAVAAAPASSSAGVPWLTLAVLGGGAAALYWWMKRK